MIVMNPLNGLGATLPLNSGQVLGQQAADVRALQRFAGASNLTVQRRGMGNVLSNVPKWVWAGAVGTVVGLVAGTLYFRRKRR